MGHAAGTWRPEEWMPFASLRWMMWSDRDNSCIPGKFLRFWTFFSHPVSDHKKVLTISILQRDKQKEVWDNSYALFKCL